MLGLDDFLQRPLNALTGLFGSVNERKIKAKQATVAQINALEPEFEKKSDDELLAMTAAFKERRRNGETLNDLLPEAFATVREAAKRTLGQRHFDVQLIGGMVLHEGKIAEMKTGEGKTLVATLPVYLNALDGKGCTSSRSTTTSPNATPNGWARSTNSSAFPWASSSMA